MPGDPKDLDARLAAVTKELENLRGGLRLLGLKQCSSCGKFFQADGKALIDVGQIVCHKCIQNWWDQHSPTLNIQERQAVEHKLARWLVSDHNAKVVRQRAKLPRVDEIDLKMVVACEQCGGTGKNSGGKECNNCEGRGTVWVVRLLPVLR